MNTLIASIKADRKNRLTFVVAVLTGLLALSACGDDDNDNSPETSNSSPAPTTVVEPPSNQSNPGTPTPEPTQTPNAQNDPVPSDYNTDAQANISAEDTPDAATPEPPPEMILPDSAFLTNMTQIYQTWNNCSAASACMLLSHYDIHVDQEDLRPIVRPNDDAKHGKSERMIEYFESHGLRAMLMHGGDIATLKAFLANDIPIIVQQWLELDDDPIGHYRVVRGYDDLQGVVRVNDSMFGGDVTYTYAEFDDMWRAFSYRYIPVYLPEQDEIVAQILGDQLDPTVNRQVTLERINVELNDRPNDAELWYSLGTNHFELGHYAEAVEAYERAASIGLPRRMLWYVYWPAAAYNEIGAHDRAIEIASTQIQSASTFGDMRYERARAWEAKGQLDQAINEYWAALEDDPMLDGPRQALDRLGAR